MIKILVFIFFIVLSSISIAQNRRSSTEVLPETKKSTANKETEIVPEKKAKTKVENIKTEEPKVEEKAAIVTNTKKPFFKPTSPMSHRCIP
jgi:hypothetical protein